MLVPSVEADSLQITFANERPALTIAIKPNKARLRIHIGHLVEWYPPLVKGRSYPKQKRIVLNYPGTRKGTRRSRVWRPTKGPYNTILHKDSKDPTILWMP